MPGKTTVVSPSAFWAVKEAAVCACCFVVVGCEMAHLLFQETKHQLCADFVILCIAYCIVRLAACWNVSLVVISDATIQLFDAMLKDLGIFDAASVVVGPPRMVRHGVQVLIQLPGLGSVRLVMPAHADDEETLRRVVRSSQSVLGIASYVLMAVSVILALILAPALVHELLRAGVLWPFPHDIAAFAAGYFALLAGIYWLRLATRVSVWSLMRRVLTW